MRTKLRKLRKEKGISSTFMAKKLGFKHPSGYCNIEKGRSGISLEQGEIIAEVLGVDISELKEDK